MDATGVVRSSGRTGSAARWRRLACRAGLTMSLGVIAVAAALAFAVLVTFWLWVGGAMVWLR
jgi:hypothetical protein